MKSFSKIFLFAILPLLLLALSLKPIQADQLQDVANKISEYEKQVKDLQNQANTLTNQIAQFNAQINLTQAKIDQTQDKILLLGGRIDQLESSLSNLSRAFSSRVVATYKMARFGQPVYTLLSSDISDLVLKFFYLKKIQESDRSLMLRLQSTQNTYKTQKGDLENLQNELNSQKQQLNSQKAAKASLLAITNNDEKKYQALLAAARAEYEAIQAIISGKGEETQIGHINEGEQIASIISGASPCSTGAHLHFEVRNGSSLQDPSNYLRQISFTYSYESNQYDYYGTINPHGSWNWPLNEPIIIHQGYGSHGYSSFYPGGIHTGIDMGNTSGDLNVKAVKNGTLYRGGVSCSGSTLRYVRVHNDEGGIDTFYLHVNY